jgi:hypothetical protein
VTQRSRTAPASRAMPRGKGRGIEVCSNVQTAVDSKPQRRIAHDVTNETGARDGLSPRALQAQEGLGSPGDAVAAVGSYHGEEGKTCLKAGLPPYVARPITSANQQLGLFRKDDCLDAGATETSQWPAGARLTCRVATGDLGRPSRSDAPATCKACPRKPQGTRHKGGRRLTRWVDAHLWEARAQRVRSRPAVRQQRQQLVEPPFGTRQRWGEQGFCVRRGLEKVRTELRSTGLAYNLRRVVHIVGIPRLRAALGSVRVRGLSKRTGAVRAGSAGPDGHQEDTAMSCGKVVHGRKLSAEGFDTVWRLVRPCAPLPKVL